ncbi:MAG: hypothetical protein O2901_15020 [Verrucomicrobia bacterium]|nr:hypothetical protein [Verrucomicrobiota bacterium]
MKQLLTPGRAATFLVTVLLATIAPAGDEALDDETKARLAKADAGDDQIDIAAYPDEIKANYRTFKSKCSQCHTLARPVNSDYALPSEWSRYVKRMMRKPGSGIGRSDAKKIYEFLAYDSSVRKKELQGSKLEKLTPKEKKEDEEKIAELLSKSK